LQRHLKKKDISLNLAASKTHNQLIIILNIIVSMQENPQQKMQTTKIECLFHRFSLKLGVALNSFIKKSGYPGIRYPGSKSVSGTTLECTPVSGQFLGV